MSERLERLSWRLEPKVAGRIVWLSKEPATKESFGFADDGMTPRGIYGKHAVNLEIKGGVVMGKGDMWADAIHPNIVSSLDLKEGDGIKIGILTGRVEVL